jgi:hypothetical protein
MFKDTKVRVVAGVVVIIAVIALSTFVWSSAIAGKNVTHTKSDVIWTWGEGPIGSSKLTRDAAGVNAKFKSSGLIPDQAVTFWIMFFNYPEECVAGPFNCSIEDLGAGTAAQGDFHWASGLVIGSNGKATFRGNLRAGELSASGLAEFPGGCLPGLPDCGGPVGLNNIEGALVVLALHSHGPAQSGDVLDEQLSTFLGGCEVFTGTLPGGFAADKSELAVNVGECATFQVSPHAPSP